MPGTASQEGAAFDRATRVRTVLFLTGIDGAPLRYRVHHLGEQLAASGFECALLYHSDAAALAAARLADCVVLFRCPFSAMVAAVVTEARGRNVPVVFSVDDLVFRSDLVASIPGLDRLPGNVQDGFRSSVAAYERSCTMADYFLGSTETLATAARELGMPAFVHRNGLGRALVARSEAARVAGRDPNHRGEMRPLRLGFLSGTMMHDRDLEHIAPALARVMDRFPEIRLVLGGPVKLPAALERHAARVERFAAVPWSELPARIAALDVNLAPLEPGSRFNEAKSEVKWIEAALVGVPTVASATPAFRVATGDGEWGLLAAGEAAWEEALARLATERAFAEGLGQAARRHASRCYGPEVQSDAIAGIFAEIIERGARQRGPVAMPIAMEAGDGSSVALEPAAAPYDCYQLETESGGPLGPGREVEQGFVCSSDGVWRVDVQVGTYCRRNDHVLRIRIEDDARNVLGERSIPAAMLLNQSWVSVEIDARRRPHAGQSLRIVAEAPGAVPGNEVLLFHAAAVPAPPRFGELRVGGEELSGRTLAFRSFTEVIT